MSKLIAYLKALITRLEHAAVGDVQKILSPLHKMHADLNTASVTATIACDQAKVNAAQLEVKAITAAKAATNLGTLLGK